MAHTASEVIPKGCTSRLITIQCANDDDTLAGIAAELWAKRAPDFLSNWRGYITFSMSAFLTSKSFSAATFIPILTDSLETTLAYVVV